jgi:hypothetical protein
MPNVSEEEYKQFMFDLNELKKEMKNMTHKKICSPQPLPASFSPGPGVRRNSNDNKPLGNSALPEGLAFDWHDSSGIKDEHLSRSPDMDRDDVDGIMIDSPSDLVSVVLEEDPVPEPMPVRPQPLLSAKKRKRRPQQPNHSKANGNLHVGTSSVSGKQSPSGTHQNSHSSAQNFLKLLNEVQSESLSLNELLLLKKTINTRITSLTASPRANQVNVSSPRNSVSSKISLNSIAKNKGITITSMPLPDSGPGPNQNLSSVRKRRQVLSDSVPESASSSVKMEMIDVTPNVADYCIAEDDEDYDYDPSAFDPYTD